MGIGGDTTYAFETSGAGADVHRARLVGWTDALGRISGAEEALDLTPGCSTGLLRGSADLADAEVR